MKALIFICILVIPFLAGCSTTYYVPQISDAEEFVDAQAKLKGRSAIVTLVDETEIRLDSTRMRPDSVIGVEEDTRIREEFPLSQIKEIETSHVGRGAGRGALNGIIWGGALGVIVGAGLGAEHGSAVAGALGGGVAGALEWGLLGSVVGMVFLSTEHYTFSLDTAADSEAPAGSSSQETKEWGGTNPRYVLVVEEFLEETDFFVAITWQGKTVKLRKSEITIEKHEKGYRVTVPARLLK